GPLLVAQMAMGRRVAPAEAGFVDQRPGEREVQRRPKSPAYDPEAVPRRRRGGRQRERRDGLEMAAVAEPGREAEIAEEETARAAGEELAVRQLDLIQKCVARPALALRQPDAAASVVPAEKPVPDPRVAAADAGVHLDERGRAQVPRHPEAEAEDLGVELVAR